MGEISMRSVLLVACAIGAPAVAQNADFKALMEKTNADAPLPAMALIEADARETLIAIAKKDGAACIPTGVVLGAAKPITSAAFVVTAVMAGQVRNAWTAYGRAIGCPSSLPTRFMIVQLADGKVLARTVNDGETLANPGLMRDTSAQAGVAAYQVVRNADAACTGDDMRMLGTRVLTKSSDLGPDFYGSYFTGSWQEAWKFSACGKSVEVPVNFKADGQGGAYTEIKGSEAKFVN